MTPSLLPRPALLQGVIAGLSFGAAYLCGRALTAIVRRTTAVRWSARVRRRVWWGVGIALLVGIVPVGALVLGWQNGVRAAVEMPPLDALAPWLAIAGFVVTVALCFAIANGCVRLFRRITRRDSGWLRGRGIAAITVIVVVAVGGTAVVAGAVAAVAAVYLGRNGTVSADSVETTSEFRSAGPDSAIDWDTLGRHGSDFVGGGPTANQISALTEHEAIEPIRVYAGLDSAPDVRARAALVVDELERTGAFDRKWLVVATTTGSGWLEPQTVDAFEYLHGGDTAIAAMQYAYTPSWVSFLFDPDAPVSAADALFDAVHDKWETLDPGDRPELLVYGLSLGAHGTQAVFDDLTDLRASTDGAMLVGSPNSSPLWRELQSARDPGSPVWRPVLDNGREVRWLSQLGDERLLPGPWLAPRVVYLQHATDPVTWLTPELLWSSPEWLGDARAPDVSPSMQWIPGVTAVQVVVDMLMGESVPARHGHNYGDVVLSGWRSVSGDGGLDAAAIDRIQEEIEGYALSDADAL